MTDFFENFFQISVTFPNQANTLVDCSNPICIKMMFTRRRKIPYWHVLLLTCLYTSFFVVCRMHWPIQRQSHFEASVSFGEVRDVRMTSPLWFSLTKLTPTTSNKGCRKYSPPRPHQQRNVAALTSPCVGNHLHNRLKQLEIFIFNDLSSWFKSIFSNSNLISSFTQTLVIHLQNIVKFKRIV